jgi:hypothetical protein
MAEVDVDALRKALATQPGKRWFLREYMDPIESECTTVIVEADDLRALLDAYEGTATLRARVAELNHRVRRLAGVAGMGVCPVCKTRKGKMDCYHEFHNALAALGEEARDHG